MKKKKKPILRGVHPFINLVSYIPTAILAGLQMGIYSERGVCPSFHPYFLLLCKQMGWLHHWMECNETSQDLYYTLLNICSSTSMLIWPHLFFMAKFDIVRVYSLLILNFLTCLTAVYRSELADMFFIRLQKIVDLYCYGAVVSGDTVSLQKFNLWLANCSLILIWFC